MALAEGVAGGFAGVYPVLKALEEQGRVRRGYFVSGLGAAQFAHPRRGRPPARRPRRAARPSRAMVLAATDPAQPYGAALPWPDDRRPTGPGRGRPRRLSEGGPSRNRWSCSVRLDRIGALHATVEYSPEIGS